MTSATGGLTAVGRTVLANKSEIRYYIKDNNHGKSGATHYEVAP
jgi:hypothetical protein